MSFDEFKNTTHNQHFVSQAEQRLNSCSPDPYSKKAEIYRFDVVEKSHPRICLKGKSAIKRNLSFQDLFTLARIGESERLNFERLFKKYEDGYPNKVADLLDWIATARGRVEDYREGINLQEVEGCDFPLLISHAKYIYTYKLLNWLRNPYKIKETLKSFDLYLNHSIDKPGAIELYIALTDKNGAEEQYICHTYGVSPKEYKEWIRLLLLFLYAEGDESSILEGFVEEFFQAKEFTNTIVIHVFDEQRALLPDTGVVIDAPPGCLATYMNVSKGCVISLQHTFIDGEYIDEIVRRHKLPKATREKLMNKLGNMIFGKLYINDEAALAGYNKICVRGAALQVFSASSKVQGVEVVESGNSD
ncbi:hypothetical protein NTJ56_19155 [Burkholderia contaminans]|uniref:hypothetical protein n=1 Tax=Burkholderia contaminans TaxID=488447 RepID=UPI001CF4948B|nr:hypothetical protein [Burkholderia contaminans]MCA7916040.1 hypothetical protein [Burkholderia contaminans]UUX40566.1 hypothetical protein NTJ56_19155 [Burkholderia contaminans]